MERLQNYYLANERTQTGVNDGEKGWGLDPRSVVKGPPAAVAAASLKADDDDQSAKRAGDVMRVSEGENDYVPAPQTVSPPRPTSKDAGDGEPRTDANNGTLPSSFGHEATTGETGTGQESPPREESPCSRQVSSSNAGACPNSSDGGGKRCGSEVPKASASETHGTCSSGKACDDDGVGAVTVIRMVGDDPTKESFIPETAKVRVGARVQWVHGGGAGFVSETFHVRNGCPIIKNGWVTECSFSLSASQSRFTHTFKQAGTFVVSSTTLPSEDDRKRGEIVVEKTSNHSHSDSDSFESADNATSTSPDDDFHDVAILADTAATHGGARKPVMDRFAPSMVGGSRLSAALVGAHSEEDSGEGKHDSDGSGRALVGRSVLGRKGQKDSADTACFAEHIPTLVAISPQASRSSPAECTLSTGGADQTSGCDEGGRGGGGKSDSYHSLDDTDLDDTRATHPEAPVSVPLAARAHAAVKYAAPDATIRRETLKSTQAPIGGEEDDAPVAVSVVESGQSDGGERVDNASETSSSKTKKKKSKKKKKRGAGGDAADGSGGGEKGGVDGDTGGVGGKGLSVRGVCGFDASKVEGGIEDDPALLINELEFLSRYPDRVAGMRGGGGKSQGKTLIVGGQGFMPSKPMVVQAGAAVFIKAASVWPYGGGGQERVLSISLHVVRTTKVRIIEICDDLQLVS